MRNAFPLLWFSLTLHQELTSIAPKAALPQVTASTAPLFVGGASSRRMGVGRQQMSAVQHSMILTASPPRAVSLYLLFMSAPVWRMEIGRASCREREEVSGDVGGMRKGTACRVENRKRS